MTVATPSAPFGNDLTRNVHVHLLPFKPTGVALALVCIVQRLDKSLSVLIIYQIVYLVFKEGVCEVYQIHPRGPHKRSNVYIVSPVLLSTVESMMRRVIALLHFILSKENETSMIK